MKSLLLVVIAAGAVFYFYRAYVQESKLREAERAESEEKLAAVTEQAHAEREQAVKERDVLRAERDDARQQAVAAQAEIAGLTNTTPKPVNWFQKRLEEGSGRLSSPPTTSAVVRRSQQGAPPGTPTAPPR